VRGSLVGERHLIDLNRESKKARPVKERKKLVIGGSGAKKNQIDEGSDLSEQRNLQ
jgi:hypothetical protein